MKNREQVLQRLSQIYEDGPYRTKTEFCDAMGISPQVLGNIQNPKNADRDISKTVLNGIAKLGYNITWLLNGTGSMRSSYVDQQDEIKELKEEIALLKRLLELREAESKRYGVKRESRISNRTEEDKTADAI
jgi:transcriptional regulator with XRE-family HTH domain